MAAFKGKHYEENFLDACLDHPLVVLSSKEEGEVDRSQTLIRYKVWALSKNLHPSSVRRTGPSGTLIH